MNEESLFNLALEKPPHERSAFLESACGADMELRRRVERLLKSHDDPGSFLQEPILPSTGGSPSEETQALEPGAAVPVNEAKTQTEQRQTFNDDLTFLVPSSRPEAIGRLEHYHILQVIGKGGFGTVLKAFDEKLHRVVAIKVLSVELSASGTARQRFIREARTAAAVTHEHVVTIHAVVEEHRPPYLVMQLIDGVTLQEKLDKVGMLSLREILRIGMQMAEGLAAAHKQGLVHRDIKPANILLENGVERVKITDFGLAKIADDASVTQSGVVAGTPMYMSPEQANGETLDHRSDLFSLGTVLYVMCTGRPPFRASGTMGVLKRVIDDTPRPIREINPEIPAWLEDIINKLHAKKPEDRFQTAKEVAELLGQRLADVQAGREIVRAGSVSDGHAKTVAHASGTSAKRSLAASLLWLGGGVAVAMIVLAVTLASLWNRPQQTGMLNIEWDDPSLRVTLVDKATGDLVYANSTENGASFPVPFGTYKFLVFKDNKMVHEAEIVVSNRERMSVDVPEWGEVRFDASDPDIRMTVNGEALTAHVLDGRRLFVKRLPKGELRWNAERHGKSVASGTFTLLGGKTVDVPYAPLATTDPGWVQLFNGKDLGEWQASPGWKVVGSLLTGSSEDRQHWLGTRRQFADFHLRAEARVVKGNCYLNFRKHGTQFYRLLLSADEMCGSITLDAPFGWIGVPKATVKASPDGWYTIELIAKGPQLISRINGQIIVELNDAAEGRAGISINTEGNSGRAAIEFKSISIKDLAPEEPTGPNFALAFDGDDHVAIPSLTYDGKHPITLEAWVRVPKAPERDTHILGNGAISLRLNNGQWFAAVQDVPGPFLAKSARYVSSKEPAEANRLTHVALVASDREARLYVDGRRQQTPAALRADPVASTRPFVIGARGTKAVPDLGLVGQIDELRISRSARYDRDFTPDKRFEPDKDTLALYHFDEGQGDVLKDASGNKHDGQIVGAKWVRTGDAPATNDAPWVQLFNGKDLSNWIPDPNWRVENGILINSGRAGKSNVTELVTVRNDFADFHLRVEARVLDLESDSGVVVRFNRGQNGNCEANIAFNPTKPNEHTGSLAIKEINGKGKKNPWIPAPPDLAKPGEWFMMDLIVRGKHILCMVNGKTAAEARSADVSPRGQIMLHQRGDKTVVHFKKVEIKELPPEATPRYALAFDGVDDHVALNNLRYSGGHPITLEAWARVPNVPDRQMTIIGNTTGLAIGVNKVGRWYGGVRDMADPVTPAHSYCFSDQPCEPGKWTHLAMVLSGRTATLYVNGRAQKVQAKLRADHVPSPSLFFLGARQAPKSEAHYPFLGDVAAVRFSKSARYDRDFTPDRDFKADGDTIGLYDFKHGPSSLLKDSSGLERHGDIVGAKWINIDDNRPAPGEWASYFNGKDLTGWRMLSPGKGDWIVRDGLLIGHSTEGGKYLHSQRLDWGRFHLKMEAKLKGTGEILYHVHHNDSKGGIEITHYGGTESLSGVIRSGIDRNWHPSINKVVIPKDDWINLEVIADGPRLITKANGVVTADFTLTAEQQKKWYKQGVISIGCGSKGEWTIRKIEIKELPPTDVAPFVLLARDKRAETQHATLADAVKAAQSGDTIEIRGDGPFETKPIDLGKKALAIRASAGVRPHLRYQPTDPESTAAVLQTNGPLVLEGVTLERAANPGAKRWLPNTAVVSVNDAPVRIANCRLIAYHLFTTLHLVRVPDGIVTNCELLGNDGTHSGIGYAGPVSPRLRLENNLLVSQAVGLGTSLASKEAFAKMDNSSISLRGNTIRAVFAISYHNQISRTPAPLIESKKGRLQMDASGNIFTGGSAFGFPVFDDAIALPDAVPFLPKLVSFQDEDNLYEAGTNAFLQLSRAGKEPFQAIKTLPEWHKLWGITKSRSQVGTPVFQGGGDLFAKTLRAPDTVSSADFRLGKDSPGKGAGPGGKDLGADVDLVGPGAAYERWKKTKEYQEWRKQADALTDPGWVPLFNGKDLRGWDVTDQKGWVIKGSLLVAADRSFLNTKDSYGDFHLRATVRGGPKGVASISFRRAAGIHGELGFAGPRQGVALGLHAQAKTKEFSASKQGVLPADTWCDIDLIVRGNNATVKVDGVLATEAVIEGLPATGQIILNTYFADTRVEFKKIEIKELPAEEGWVQLFNGKNLDGWKYHPKLPGEWTVKDGILTSGGKGNYLYTVRDDYADFHLRAEVKLEKGFTSAVYFRTGFGSTWEDNKMQPGLDGHYALISRPFDENPTGSLRVTGMPFSVAEKGIVDAKEWFVLEIIAKGNRIESLVNGQPAASLFDKRKKGRFEKGHIALQMLNPDIVVRYRKIEIKELPAVPSKNEPAK